MSVPRTTIVVPAYNEERRIAATLKAYLNGFDASVHCLVVVNNSQDRTLEIVHEVAQRFPGRVTALDIRTATGKGGAIVAGFRQAVGEIIGFVDADGATTPKEFARLLAGLNNPHVDGVIASRWHPQSRVEGRFSLLRRLATVGFRWFTKILFALPYHDTQCGAKVFRRSVITTILPSLRITNMAFDVELLYRARRAGFRVIEQPTVWIDQADSSSLGTWHGLLIESWRMFRALLRLRFFR